MTFSLLFSGKPELRQDNLLHGGRLPDVPGLGLSGLHELLPGRMSGKNIYQFCPKKKKKKKKKKKI